MKAPSHDVLYYVATLRYIHLQILHSLWHSAVSLFIHATIMFACNNLHMTDI